MKKSEIDCIIEDISISISMFVSSNPREENFLGIRLFFFACVTVDEFRGWVSNLGEMGFWVGLKNKR